MQGRESQNGSASKIEEEQFFKKHLISGPYNFQHVVHTGLGHAQNADEVRSRKPSVDEDFLQGRSHASSISSVASSASLFSDYAPETPIQEDIPPIAEEGTPRPPVRRIQRKPVSPISISRPQLRSVQSHDSVRNTPLRPPRSPMVAMAPPPRTSSRIPSMVWAEYDPLMSTSLERPHHAPGFRRPTAFHLPLSPPLPVEGAAQDGAMSFPSMPAAPPRQQDNVGWPFAPQPPPSESGSQLEDVPEEEEAVLTNKRQNRMSTASIRASRSVPNMASRSRTDSKNEFVPEIPTDSFVFTEAQKSLPIKLTLDSFDSWEDDIDYCYEHEVEANCDYNWERTSIDTEIGRKQFWESAYAGSDQMSPGASPRPLHRASESIGRLLSVTMGDLGLADSQAKPPSPFQLPQFDFAITSLSTSPPLTRDNIMKSELHLKAPRPDSFDESHGFALSPSLLLPYDYEKNMDVDSQIHIDVDTFNYDNESFASFQSRSIRSSYGSESNSLSAPDSTTSYNTSHDGLRGSGGSLSSLANSFMHSKHESAILERAAEVALAHRSMSSNGSVPDLIASARAHSASVSSVVSIASNPLNTYIELSAPVVPIAPAMRKTSIHEIAIPPSASIEEIKRLSGEPMALGLARQEAETRLLPPSPSPCAQDMMEKSMKSAMHVRKHSVPLLVGKVDAPAMPQSPRGSPVGRARAATVGGRAKSYGLFPAPTVGGAF